MRQSLQERRPSYLRWSIMILLSSLLFPALIFLRQLFESQTRFPSTLFWSTTWIHVAILDIYQWSISLTILTIAIGGGIILGKRVSIVFERWHNLLVWPFAILAILLGAFSMFLFPIYALLAGPDGIRVITMVDGYEVALAQTQDFDLDFPSTSLAFIVIREDGQYYYEHLDGRMFIKHDEQWACTTLSTRQVHERVYFLCDAEPITQRTPYVDTDKQTLYLGWGNPAKEQLLDQLPFSEPIMYE